jgi:hypothetical protein
MDKSDKIERLFLRIAIKTPFAFAHIRQADD